MRTALLLACTALAAGCAPAGDEETGSLARPIAEGSLDAIGLLTFLNGPSATFELLDGPVGLDSRAARNIARHVDGADQVRGTKDDDRLDTLAELDAIPYVGATAMDKILAYARAQGLVPDLVVEGVPLLRAQADAIVAVANRATLAQLDIDAALDSRAAQAIVAARPIADVNALAALPYVGGAAIAHLRDYAPKFQPPACALSIVAAARTDAADATELLALATTRDYPAAEVVAFRVAGCADALAPAHQAELIAALEKAIDWRYDAGTELPLSAGPFAAGAPGYLGAVKSIPQAIQERIDEGSWDPAADPRGAALWGALDGTIASLISPIDQNPNGFQGFRIYLDAAECYQWAEVAIDAQTLEVRVSHKLPGC
jgi:hypothetical protein